MGQHWEQLSQGIVVGLHAVFKIRQDNPVISAGERGLPCPFDQLFVFFAGRAINPHAEVARKPKAAVLVGVAIGRAALDGLAVFNRKLCIDNHAVRVKAKHQIGEDTQIQPRSLMRIVQPVRCIQNMAIIAHAPQSMIPVAKPAERARGANHKGFVVVIWAKKIVQTGVGKRNMIALVVNIAHAFPIGFDGLGPRTACHGDERFKLILRKLGHETGHRIGH